MAEATIFTTRFDPQAQDIVPNKEYPIFSNDEGILISKDIANTLINAFHTLKLNRYYDCLEKAKIAALYLRAPEIHLGSLMIDSTEPNVAFGYKYNPPLEFHAWLEKDGNIIDLAVPGSIEFGSKLKDDIGPFLKGREPIIVAGKPPEWLTYVTYETIKV